MKRESKIVIGLLMTHLELLFSSQAIELLLLLYDLIPAPWPPTTLPPYPAEFLLA